MAKKINRVCFVSGITEEMRLEGFEKINRSNECADKETPLRMMIPLSETEDNGITFINNSTLSTVYLIKTGIDNDTSFKICMSYAEFSELCKFINRLSTQF
jgi:hypothetical protein